MEFLSHSLRAAFALIFALDHETFTIVGVSLKVSLLSTLIASLAAVPLGAGLALGRWPGRRLLVTLANTLQATPTVVIGLVVYAFISRRGVFGALDLLYTQEAIVIGQVILIIPLIASLTVAAIGGLDPRYRRTAIALGAGPARAACTVLAEARYGVLAAVIAAFGRVIAEIGISMMLGGNIKGLTRTMTTAMALEYDKGAFVTAVALGLILMAISFGVNFILHFCQGRGRA